MHKDSDLTASTGYPLTGKIEKGDIIVHSRLRYREGKPFITSCDMPGGQYPPPGRVTGYVGASKIYGLKTMLITAKKAGEPFCRVELRFPDISVAPRIAPQTWDNLAKFSFLNIYRLSADLHDDLFDLVQQKIGQPPASAFDKTSLNDRPLFRWIGISPSVINVLFGLTALKDVKAIQWGCRNGPHNESMITFRSVENIHSTTIKDYAGNVEDVHIECSP